MEPRDTNLSKHYINLTNALQVYTPVDEIKPI